MSRFRWQIHKILDFHLPWIRKLCAIANIVRDSLILSSARTYRLNTHNLFRTSLHTGRGAAIRLEIKGRICK